MRKKDFEKLYVPEKNDLEELIKYQKGRGDKENLHHKYRLLDLDIFRDLNRSYTQEVVFKIVTRGTGKRHLSILIDYLSRELSSQKNKEKCVLFDHENNLIEPDSFDQIIDGWSRGFEPEIKEDNMLLEDAFIEFNKFETALEDKYYDTSLTKEEGEIYNHIKELKERKYDKNKVETNSDNELKIGQFCYFEEDHKYGILVKEPDSKYFLLVTIDNELNLKSCPIADKAFVQPLNQNMKRSLSNKPKDFSHIILSAGGDKPDPKSVEMATRQFLEENFKAKGFEYIYTTHNDTDNLHTHIIVNNYSKYNGQKFSLNKFDLQELRLDYKKHLDNFGIDRTVTYKMDRKDYLQTLQKTAQNMMNVKVPHLKNRTENIEDYDMNILNFRKNGVEQLGKLSDQLYRQGERNLAGKLLEAKESFETVRPEAINELVLNTCAIIEKEAPQIAEFTKKNLSKRLGKPSDYKIDKNAKIKEEVLENYMNHLEKTKENLGDLYGHTKMTAELEKQNDKAIEYLDKRIHQVSKVMGMGQDEGRSYTR